MKKRPMRLASTPVRRSSMWLPVLMRWRRRAVREPARAGAHVSFSTRHVMWMPQIHLHWSFGCLPGRSTVPAALSSPAWQRFFRSHASELRSEREKLVERVATRVFSGFAVTARAVIQHRTDRELTRLGSTSRETRDSSRWHERQISTRSTLERTVLSSRSTLREASRFLSSRATSIRSSAHTLLKPAPLTLRATELPRAARHSEQPVTQALAAMIRSPELLWRAGTGSSGSNSGVVDSARSQLARSAQAASFVSSSPVRASSHAAPVLTSQSKSVERAVVRVTDLDSAIADRLAEDVIRRVERRVRIERERRGL